MRSFLCLLVLGLSLLGQASAATLVVLGDSLSAAHNIPVQSGWVALLDQRLSKMRANWQVINASISGETSVSGRSHLPALLRSHRPALVVIELGANDALRGLPLPALRDNMLAMVGQARQAGAKVLLLGIELPVNYGPQYRDGLRQVYAEVAQQTAVPLVPFMLDGVAQHLPLMQEDGLHPIASAEPIVLDHLWPSLQPLLIPAKSSRHAGSK